MSKPKWYETTELTWHDFVIPAIGAAIALFVIFGIPILLWR